jgi:hypothetical protein
MTHEGMRKYYLLLYFGIMKDGASSLGLERRFMALGIVQEGRCMCLVSPILAHEEDCAWSRVSPRRKVHGLSGLLSFLSSLPLALDQGLIMEGARVLHDDTIAGRLLHENISTLGSLFWVFMMCIPLVIRVCSWYVLVLILKLSS